MEKIKIKELTGRGYSLGLDFVEIFKDKIDKKEKEIIWNQPELERVLNNINKQYPEYLQEMYGRADGLGIDRETFLFNICYSGFKRNEACTDIIVKVNENEIISGHNEDGLETLDEMALIKYKKENMFYFDFSAYNSPQGTTFGWNSNGIVISVNTIHTFEYHQQGVPAWFILRDIIFCSSIEEIKNKIENIHCATGFSLNVIDKNTNKAYSVEKIYDSTDILEITDRYAHTNHIIHENAKYHSNILGCTAIRLKNANEKLKMLKDKCDREDIKNILQFYKDSSEFIYRPIGKDQYPTIATFIFDSKTNEINIYSYYDKSLVKSNFYEIKEILEF